MATAVQEDNWQPLTLTAQAIRVGVAFGVMVAITAAYQTTVVPLMEPTIRENDTTATLVSDDFLDQEKQKLTQFFPANSWQLGRTKVLKSNNIWLLMKDFRDVGNNRLELKPLTIIAFENDNDDDRWSKPVVVLNADSALLQFSELNLAFAKFGDLVGGQLQDNVTITRKSIDGNHEPLDIITSDVLLATDRIETKKDVQFLMGKHQGSGRHLIAQFEEGPKQTTAKGPNISGLSVLELVHVDRILLSTEGRGLLGDAAAIPGQRQTPGRMYASAPVEISCSGPFVFDGTHRVATFRDQVNVRRLVASGVPDLLRADLLEVYFQNDDAEASPEEGNPDAPAKEGMRKLKMQRLVAVGNPFNLTATSVSATAQGKQLIYDLIQKRIEVVGNPMAVLTKDQYRVESPRLEYELGQTPSHLGRVWSAGPGVFTGNLSQANPQETSRLSWQKEFRIEPQNGEYAVSIDGGASDGRASVSMDGKGKIDGDKMYVFLQDVTPPDSKKQRLIPHRLQGIGHIAIDTPQLVGRTNEIRTWFEFDEPQPPPGEPGSEPGRLPTATPAANASSGGAIATGPTAPPTRGPIATTPPPRTPVAPSPSQPQPAEEEKPTRFRLLGEVIQMVVRFDGHKSHLENATVTGQVQLAEMPEGDQMVDPFMVRGNVVQLLHASNNNAEIHVTGQPATVSGRGLQLFSGQLRVNQRQGRVWTEGPGELIFPLDRDFQGRKLAVPEYFNVQWQGNLEAQHDQITFNRAVRIKGRQSQLTTAKLTITLNRPISFTETATNKELSAKFVECSGGVQLYNRNMEEGIVRSVDQFEGKTLSINQVTGDIHAQGPGVAKTVMVGNFSGQLPGQPAPVQPQTDKGLTYVRVDFVSHVSGNMHRKEISFHKVDQAVYGPVLSWDEEIDQKNLAAMNPASVSLRCDQLTIVQHPENSEMKGAEILAIGNGEVQGKMFTAWADRISYATAKEMLTMSGNGRNAVQLTYQQRIGGTRSTATAGKIQYWPKTREFELFDGKEIGVSGIQANDLNIPKIPGLR
ncbi:hypothetical protein [Blastopirellula marina]|uniref:Organic solvent tolerance-like N-terminal domain-containing protein n=1 Tax=Blastopirellula marina TaxID=124 RepID=A0A2S8FLL4_9BACT|nr:hypothetical protein [Blastopirellula marina]PQO33079.1 hypothetical protein C5Y98_18260 [Blastopirellula marina]PTL43246.1 hypothetical protein C5Y97_18270 [Blastopirellula marina]